MVGPAPTQPSKVERDALAARWRGNFLLASLPPDLQTKLAPKLALVQLEAGQRAFGNEQPWRHVLFPVSAVISVVSAAPSGNSTLLAIVGSEGLIGLPGVLGTQSAFGEAIVHTSGDALRMGAKEFAAELSDERVRQILLRYVHAFLSQVAQTAFCNRFHPSESQLSTLLLRILDRTGGSHIQATHDQLARMTGVRRETITLAATRLQQRGALVYQRGLVQVANRTMLEGSACECYGIVENAYAASYFGGQQPPWQGK